MKYTLSPLLIPFFLLIIYIIITIVFFFTPTKEIYIYGCNRDSFIYSFVHLFSPSFQQPLVLVAVSQSFIFTFFFKIVAYFLRHWETNITITVVIVIELLSIGKIRQIILQCGRLKRIIFLFISCINILKDKGVWKNLIFIL